MIISDWRKRRNTAIPVTLPSGLDVTVRRLDFTNIITTEGVDSAIMATFMEAGRGSADGGELAVTAENLRAIRAVYIATARMGLVSPRVEPVPSSEAISYDELDGLSIDDLTVIFNAVTGAEKK